MKKHTTTVTAVLAKSYSALRLTPLYARYRLAIEITWELTIA